MTEMPAHKWIVIARNEYRIRTSRIRKIRSHFPYLIVGALAAYVVFIAPAFVSLFIDDLLALMLSHAAMAMMQIMLFIVFIYFIMIPVSQTLREQQASQLEIFLAAPVKPSDLLLGEFLGEMPFYSIFIVVIIGFFTAVLNPLGLDLMQIGIIIMVFVLVFLSASWIGTVISALLRTKLGKTARGRDIGRALAMIIALPLIVLIYAIQFGGLIEALSDPKSNEVVKAILSLLPSSWGAEVIVRFATHPGNVGGVAFDVLTRVGGLIVFLIAILWLGSRVANRAYSLEPTTFISARAHSDGVFYNLVKYLGGGRSFGTLLVSVFKDYSRRLENLSNVVYIIGVLFVMVIFVVPKSGFMGATYILMMAQFLFPILVVMVNGEVTVRGKETLFIFRKAPSGEGRFVKAMLVKGWLMAVPIAGLVTVVITILSPQMTVLSLLMNTGFMMLFIAAYTAFILGLFLLNPAFSEKSVKLWLNIMIAIFASIGLFAVSLMTLATLGVFSETIVGIFSLHLIQSALSWLVGLVFLYLGKRRLTRIE
jgi:hypothetical protein